MTQKKYNSAVIIFELLLLYLILLSSCINTNRGYPEKNFYILDITRNAIPTDTKKEYVIEVRQFLSPYTKSGKEFVYKFPDGEYKSDFYNGFFIQPNKIIKEETRQWLEDSGLFKTVLD
ncbi:MAG: hypothetical protein ACRENO_10330, partial [Thermodesulfobacteriota bacterium]